MNDIKINNIKDYISKNLKLIIVIVMLGTVSFVFQALTGLQNVLIDSNIVS